LPRPRRISVGRDLQVIRRSLLTIGRALARLAPALDAAASGVGEAGWAKASGRRRPKLSPARRAALKVQGQYLGSLRSLKARQRAHVKAVRASKGARAAIALAKRLARAGREG
jgi:hypothetical protein